MSFKEFTDTLTKRLSLKLPGEKAHVKMLPESRNKNFYHNINQPAEKCAVLILLYPEKEKIKTVFILRTDYKGIHSGQISFPGGRFEKSDTSLIETALRESYEEIGIDISTIHVIGCLSELYIPPSNFLVLPVIGYATEKPVFHIDTNEVVKTIEADIFQFIDKGNIKEKIFCVSDGFKIKAPYYELNEYAVWGATAMIISEFAEVIKTVEI